MSKTIICFLIWSTLLLDAANAIGNADRKIDIDVQNVVGEFDTFYKASIGAGRANEGLRADWQKQLAEIKQDAGFQYIRMHGLLEDDMGVYRVDEQGREHYNFQYIDALYDYILGIGMKPFVELSFMPSGLASGEKTVFWWRGNITPPGNYEKWGKLIQTLTQHWTDRYGEDEVKTWYFEVWNEPNLDAFWAGTKNEYFKLYEYAAKAVKSVNRDYRIGGPATAGGAWIPEMIRFCRDNNVALDYVSTHTYGVRQGFLDEYGITGTVLAEDENAVSGDVLRNRKEISESVLPDLELHYTEWSASYSPADPVHDSYHSAAYILQKLKQVYGSVQSMSYWVFTDIFEEPGPRFKAFHGGFGLMNTQGIKKPAYFTYLFLNRLGEMELSTNDPMSFATKQKNGEVQILFWDYSFTLPDKTNNQQYYIQDLPASPKGNIQVKLNNLKKGKYKYKIFQVGYEKNDAYTAYIKLGAPAQLTIDQVKKLKSYATGEALLERNIKVASDGNLDLEFPLRENDVYLIELIPQ